MDTSATPSNPEDPRILKPAQTAPTIPADPSKIQAPRTVEPTPTVPSASANPASPADPRTAAFRAGQLVGEGRFELKRELGRGGMGIVWLAFDRLLQEQTALKFLPPAIRGDPTALDDLRRETQRTRKLSHPHIISIHDLFVIEGEDAFISMAYMEGQSLAAERLKQTNKTLEWEQLAPWIRQLCDALDYAHREQVIHRDLKPANLLLDGQRRLKLTDFGIARVVTDTASRIAAEQGSSGTTVYMSPQQLEGKPSLPTDDIYSLGATLYELLTTKPPFYTGDVEDQIRFRLAEPLGRRQRELNVMNAVPTHVERTIMACLDKDPGARPRNIQEVAERLGLQKKTHRKGTKSPRPKPAEASEVAEADPTLPDTTRKGKPRTSKRSVPAAVPVEAQPEAQPRSRGLLWTALIGVLMVTGMWSYFQGGIGTQPPVGKRTNTLPAPKTITHANDGTANPILPPGKTTANPAVANPAATTTNVAQVAETITKPATNQPIVIPDQPRPSPFPVVGRPWTNTLGMIFVTVSTNIPSFSVWETRVQDYRAFVTATNRSQSAPEWKAAGFVQGTNHPAVNIRWHDARAFCQWLTETERSAGKLNTNQSYRLPRAKEWDLAAGLVSAVATPATVPAKQIESFPWGTTWPPPTNAGNFFGQEAGFSGIGGFRDGFTNTAPVGSFPPNRHGLHDLAGNVWEWCEDSDRRIPAERVVKGGSWQTSTRAELADQSYAAKIQLPYVGFRCVLEFQSTTNK